MLLLGRSTHIVAESLLAGVQKLKVYRVLRQCLHVSSIRFLS